MHISQLTLSHFRSHKYTQFQVESGPVALFGSNGAGKTNLIEAISLLSPGKGIRRANTADLSKSPDNIGWKLNAEVVSGVSSNLIETSWETTSSRIVKINDKVVKQNDLAKVFRVVWLLPSMDRPCCCCRGRGFCWERLNAQHLSAMQRLLNLLRLNARLA